MISRALSLAAFCVLAILAFARPVSACSCAMPPVCGAFWNADRVFTGRAEVTPLGPGAQRARFRIEESFRGPTGVIEIEGRGIGGSCAYAFVDGARYLVYARQVDSGKWSASLCSRTAPLDQASEDVVFARNVVQDPRQLGKVSVSAQIGEPGPGGHLVGVQPLAGATITLRGGSVGLTAETSLQGTHQFSVVPPGRYVLSITLTPQFDPVPPASVTVRGSGDCAGHAFIARRKPKP